jgi:hypothetical protein
MPDQSIPLALLGLASLKAKGQITPEQYQRAIEKLKQSVPTQQPREASK